MVVKLLTEHHFEFLSLKGGCRGSSESTMSKCHFVGNLMPRLKYESDEVGRDSLLVLHTYHPVIILGSSSSRSCSQNRSSK